MIVISCLYFLVASIINHRTGHVGILVIAATTLLCCLCLGICIVISVTTILSSMYIARYIVPKFFFFFLKSICIPGLQAGGPDRSD